MITYEYFCEANGQSVTVEHGMKESIATWGDLCQRAGHELGSTEATALVERKISGGLLSIVSGSGESAPMPGPCCGNPSSCRHH